MSMLDEIKLFIGLNIQQNKDGIYITQPMSNKEILKSLGMEESRQIIKLMITGCKL